MHEFPAVLFAAIDGGKPAGRTPTVPHACDLDPLRRPIVHRDRKSSAAASATVAEVGSGAITLL
jgi:hypothetical protein